MRYVWVDRTDTAGDYVVYKMTLLSGDQLDLIKIAIFVNRDRAIDYCKDRNRD